MGATVVVWDDELFDRLDTGVVLTGLSDRRIRQANPAACRILGRARADLVGAAWAGLIPPSPAGGWLQVVRLLSGEETTALQKVQFVRLDGNLIQVLITALVVDGLVNGDRREPCCLGQIADISDGETARRQLELVVENSPVALSLVNQSDRLSVHAGGSTPALLDGLKAAERSSIFEVFSYAPEVLELVRRAKEGEPGYCISRAHGCYYELHVRPIYNSRGEVGHVAVINTDVTEREQAHSDQKILSDLAHQALRIVEPDRLWNHAASVLACRLNATVTFHTTDPGHEPDLVAAVGELPPADVIRESRESMALGQTCCHQACDPNDESGCHSRRSGCWSTLSVPVGRPGAPAAVLTVHRADRAESLAGGVGQQDRHVGPGPMAGPITRYEAEFIDAVASVLGSAAVRFAMEREAHHRALHDSLTGLPNRTALLDRLERSLRRPRNETRHTGVIFVDLDGFKTINDTFGHRFGDTVLRLVSDRLRTSVRPDDIVARLAGDEFAILCQHVESVTEVENVAHRIIAALAMPIALPDTDVTVTASVGVAISGTNLTDPDRLLNASDIAMYTAKRAGPGCCVVHQPAMRLDTAVSTPSPDHP